MHDPQNLDRVTIVCHPFASEGRSHMKPVVFACVAMAFYALENVLMEQKLTKYNALSLLVYFYLAMLPLALAGLGYLKLTNAQIVLPTGNAILLAMVVGVMYFFADAFYVSAYTTGGTLMVVTTIVLIFPAFASLIKFFWVGGLPNRYQIIGYALAVLAVLCVAKGNVPAKP